MKMNWGCNALPLLVLVVVLGTTLQHARAEPRPDFGIKAVLSGTPRVITLSTTLSNTFDKVDNTNLPLVSGYNLLNNMKTALLQIGTKITTKGTAITTALNTLAADKSNVNAAPLFQAVSTAITELSQLVQTGLTAELAVLKQLNSKSLIVDGLGDGFRSIVEKLNGLSGALDRLKAGVIAARDAPGNSPTAVSSNNLRKFITSTMVPDVQDALTRLNGEVPSVQYVIESAQKRLVVADAFISDIKDEAQENVGFVRDDFQDLQNKATIVGENIAAGFDDLVTPVYNAQLAALSAVQSTIEGISTYADDLQPALTSLDLLLEADFLGTLTTSLEDEFANYNTALDGSIGTDTAIKSFFVAEACGVVKSLVNSLAASGDYAEYCFVKYSNKAYSQFGIAYYLLSQCYQVEQVRLERLQDLTATITQMIIYDIEDLGEAISSCAPLNDGAPCLTLIGPHYEVLATTIDDKQTYLLNYVDKELKLSLQRVGACVAVSKYSMVVALQPIPANLATCNASGYAA
ncbi:hypothetical protein ZHAS_00014418 [Anopheles sinensis]|uniref:Secreted protein n=1 Tax=Anopheles sinensis TaxID=74873 RepID=A0A084W875_ANOSI|nr:hypothetical protein ZHAS_00014418 [Anopheles sinensis]